MSEQKTVSIKYIGKKEFFPDFVSQSGKSWNGYGDVQEVSAEQAKKLLVHSDEFAEKNAHDALLAAQESEIAPVAPVAPELPAAPTVPIAPAAPVAAIPTAEEIAVMNKVELLALASTQTEITVNDAAPVAALRKQLIAAFYPTV